MNTIFENFNISKNNIISVELIKILGHKFDTWILWSNLIGPFYVMVSIPTMEDTKLLYLNLNAIIKCYLRFSIARNEPKCKKNRQIFFLHMVQVITQKKNVGCSQMWLNLRMNEWWPFWLYHKINQKKHWHKQSLWS